MVISKPIRDCDAYQNKKKCFSKHLESINKYPPHDKLGDILTDLLTDSFNQYLHFVDNREKLWDLYITAARWEYPDFPDNGWQASNGWDPEYDHTTMPNYRAQGLFLTGTTGVGKTTVMEIFQNHFKSKFVEADALCADFMNTKPEDKDDWWAAIAHGWGRLILDDIGNEKKVNNYGPGYELIPDVILVRYNYWKETQVTTFMTTKLGTKDFTNRYGEQTYSRVKQMCECYVVKGPDLRLETT